MTRIIVFSDSHGETKKMHDILSNEKCDMVFHLGDCFDDMQELSMCYELPIYGVLGNVDYVDGPRILKIQVESKTILLCHGHQFHVKSQLFKLHQYAEEEQADLALFGHTHIPTIEESEIVLMNPGSISRPLHHDQPSYGVIEINDDKMVCKIKYIN
ncbi:MAG: metallophosphoesterase [Clostridia bacterium]|nr:metallophosphoesterase [Clostridia bacterium]